MHTQREISQKLSKPIQISSQDGLNRSVVLTYDLNTITLEEVNKLRTHLYSEAGCHAIDALKVIRNTSYDLDDIYLGLLSYVRIDDSKWNGKTVQYMGDTFSGSFKLKIVGKSPHYDPGKGSMIMIKDIIVDENSNGLSIVGSLDDPIIWLREGEEIDMELFIRKGQGKEHAKFRIITAAFVKLPKEPSQRINFVIESRGVLNPIDIFNRAIQEMQ